MLGDSSTYGHPPGTEEDGESSRPTGSASAGLDSDDEGLTFDSPQDEASHYREKYRRIMDALDETRAELDEFQASSKELEDELEKELAATEKQKSELKDKIRRLETEKEEWMAKHIALQKLHSSTVGNMQREMDNLRSERDKTLVALRDLEMGNDELERNERVAVSSLLDLESKYNRAIEEKTLLEQEVVQRQELEEECQRLKDDLRDANTEIGILRDQATRGVPTPPSSVSVTMSPKEEPSQDLPLDHSSSLEASFSGQPQRHRPSKTPGSDESRPGLRGIPKSPTVSSIPTMSPSAKKLSSVADSPIASLSRSSTLRNMAANGVTASPSLRRVRGGLPAASPGRVANANLAAKNKGFKLLHELQARLKATDDKLGTRVPKRNVSAPMPLGQSKRNVSNLSTVNAPAHFKASHSRVTDLQKPDMTPVADADKSGATFLSPNGWVMVDDEDTPTNQNHGMPREPVSPLMANFRSTSSASTSSKPLPSRPGIPSPLAASLSKSTNRPASRSSNLALSSRAPSRLHDDGGGGKATGMTKSDSGRFASTRSVTSSVMATPNGMSRSSSRQALADSRPMSPSMIPHSTRSHMRSPTPNLTGVLSASTSRAPSRQGATRSIGKGPPPAITTQYPHSAGLTSSTSQPASTPSGFKRSKRRSSVGVGLEGGDLPPTGIPAPKASPGRPISVPVFGANTPPPVPRIPSAHLRESARRSGFIGKERPKSQLGM
ncbi:hypothetical protein BD324DRAFT_611190 [Kockovaella imperatae]|uniref:NUDE domain-containing protein n=1 Tax=Kockovaella imperatae TaxID=4999 RepID=A0A1Y1UR58_9TREE|nr:hypothetical protein BD324DRAFT_611190 [Kockovaella imperatae]ORX40543.1 hypothetical protein BD324DRAFT_611190 [Kockovaella imperatae]